MPKTARTKSPFSIDFSRDAPAGYRFVVRRLAYPGNPTGPIPGRITLLHPVAGSRHQDELYLDMQPVVRRSWKLDNGRGLLQWTGAFGGGSLTILSDGAGSGIINGVGVSLQPSVEFQCDVALNAGVAATTDGDGNITGLTFDPTATQWQSAAWDDARMSISYWWDTTPIIPDIAFIFTDLYTKATAWQPTAGNYLASLSTQSGENGQLQFVLSFNHNVGLPTPEQGGTTPPPAGTPDTVFPYVLTATMDAAVQNLTGAMMIDNVDVEQANFVGIRGTVQSALQTGYFQSGNAVPFGVFHGKLAIGGLLFRNSRLRGDVLSWRGLSRLQQVALQLPEDGSLTLPGVGNSEAQFNVRRLSADRAIALHSQIGGTHVLGTIEQNLSTLVGDPSLSNQTLEGMTVFKLDTNNNWYDAVQSAVLQDLTTIMNSAIPGALWNLLYSGVTQPTLTGTLATVANSLGPNGQEPGPWYQSLAVAVMAYGVANNPDPYCQYINGTRAKEWLKLEMATSPIYMAHTQLLFQYEFANVWPEINDYLNDQTANATTYATTIQTMCSAVVQEIQDNVASGDGTVAALTAAAQLDATTATTNSCFWAYSYYLYKTSPALLQNVYLASVMNGGSLNDQTALMRDFQDTVSKLTALDQSGYFAQRYKEVLNTFVGTAIVPSLFGFDQAMPDDLQSIMTLYLQNFVTNNLQSTHTTLVQAAKEIQAFMADANFSANLTNCINQLQAISDGVEITLAFPSIAKSFVAWFNTTYPQYKGTVGAVGTMLTASLAGLGLFNIFTACKDWSSLSTEEQAEVATTAAQLGVQAIFAVAKRGVAVWSLWGVDGLTVSQRAAAMARVVASGESALDVGLARVSNSFARWLGGAALGTAASSSGELTATMVANTTISDAESSLVLKVFGRTVGEFVGTRLMVLFAIAGVAYSIVNLAEGEPAAQEAIDGLAIVSGTLMVGAIIGGIVAAEGTAVATMASVAGPLAIVAALAGVGVLIWLLCQKPTDPMQTFVQNYIQGTQFYVSSSCSAIDYVTDYMPTEAGASEMLGFTLGSGGQVLSVAADGSLSTAAAPGDLLPDTVWQCTTDGNGFSYIFTFATDANGAPICLFLTLNQDGSISFCTKTAPNTGTVTTQRWQATPVGNAALNGGDLASLSIQLQAVTMDPTSSIYAPSANWAQMQNGALSATTSSSATTFVLSMSPIAPWSMAMRNVTYRINGPWAEGVSYSPTFAAPVSQPLTFALSLQGGGSYQSSLPFVSFAPGTGAVGETSGMTPTTPLTQPMTITATNPSGTAAANFTITVPNTKT